MNDLSTIQKNLIDSGSGTFEERALNANKTIINNPNSGMILYQTTDKDKLDFQRVK